MVGHERQLRTWRPQPNSPGSWRITLDADAAAIYQVADPIYPGYLKQAPADREYYQTTFGSRPGAVLFPSAGRHFTSAMLDGLRTQGVAVVDRHIAQRGTLALLGALCASPPRRQRSRRTRRRGGLGSLIDRHRLPPSRALRAVGRTADVINERRRAGGRIFVRNLGLRTLETVVDDSACSGPSKDSRS